MSGSVRIRNFREDKIRMGRNGDCPSSAKKSDNNSLYIEAGFASVVFYKAMKKGKENIGDLIMSYEL